jgi:hypothetical protein
MSTMKRPPARDDQGKFITGGGGGKKIGGPKAAMKRLKRQKGGPAPMHGVMGQQPKK